MFNTKSKSTMGVEKSKSGTSSGTTLIGAGTTLTGDISSNNDLRIDGAIIGNIKCSAKVVIGANGSVEGNLEGNQADILGKVTGDVRVKDMLQLRSDCNVTGDLYAGKLQVEPDAVFNGQCRMGAEKAKATSSSIVEMKKEEQLLKQAK